MPESLGMIVRFLSYEGKKKGKERNLCAFFEGKERTYFGAIALGSNPSPDI
jgi:hypothetical protein